MRLGVVSSLGAHTNTVISVGHLLLKCVAFVRWLSPLPADPAGSCQCPWSPLVPAGPFRSAQSPPVPPRPPPSPLVPARPPRSPSVPPGPRRSPPEASSPVEGGRLRRCTWRVKVRHRWRAALRARQPSLEDGQVLPLSSMLNVGSDKAGGMG